MKKKLLLAAGAVLLASAVSAFIYVNKESNQMDELFNANVEALTEGEIIVGTLCMKWPNAACTSLGEVFEEHIRA